MDELEQVLADYGLRFVFTAESRSNLKKVSFPKNRDAKRCLEILSYADVLIQLADPEIAYRKFVIPDRFNLIAPIAKDLLVFSVNPTHTAGLECDLKTHLYFRGVLFLYKIQLMKQLVANPSAFGIVNKKVELLTLFDQKHPLAFKEMEPELNKRMDLFKELYESPSEATEKALHSFSEQVSKALRNKKMTKKWLNQKLVG